MAMNKNAVKQDSSGRAGTRSGRKDKNAARGEAGQGADTAKPAPVKADAYVRIYSWLAAVLGGVAGAAAFDPLALRWLIVLAPLGCFLAIRWAPSPRGAFLRTLAFGWVYYFGTLHWLLTIRIYAPMEILGIAGVALLGLYLALYPGLAAYVLRRWLWTPNPVLQFVLFACVWLLAEWLRTLGRLGMPLAELGHAWAVWPRMTQIAQWLGELGVSLEVLWVAGLLFLFSQLKRFKQDGGKDVPQTYLTADRLYVIGLAVALIWSFLSGHQFHAWLERVQAAESNQAKLNVAMLQPNIPQDVKLASYASPDEKQRKQLSDQMNERQESMLFDAARPEWELVILPETSFTEFDFYQNAAIKGRVSAMARRIGADMIVSANRDASDPKHFEVYNSAYFVHQDGTFDKAVYDKMRLVPFGEDLPYFDLIPGFQENFVGIGSFTEGKNPPLFTTKGYRFGVLICFESTFSSSARALVKKGADFLTVITNDAWYGLSAGAATHHNVSLLRAVETRRYVLRDANTGISSIISPAGEIESTLGLDKQGFVEWKIAPDVSKGVLTWFVRFGNSWLILPALLIGVAAVIGRRRKKLEQEAAAEPSA